MRNNKAVASAVRSVTVLGATGSIGDSTMDLLRGARDRYQVEALTANSNVEALAKLAREFNARFAAVADPARLSELKDALAGTRTECGAGESAIIEAAARPADWVMAAVSGAAGLKPALAAVDRGAAVALANKECLVCAGDFFMQRAAKAGACILPADSEHNALFQALGSGNREELVRVIITASGGPFRTWAAADIEQATLAQALKHPNWSMGQKITIDSASMMNKGLEVIEASYLFALTPDEIDVLVHPQSIIHGMVEFSDRSVVAQLGAPDMRIPIAHCLGLARPDRRPVGETRSRQDRAADLRGAGFRAVPGLAAGLRRATNRPRRDHGIQRRQRGGGRRLHRRQDQIRRASRAWSKRP